MTVNPLLDVNNAEELKDSLLFLRPQDVTVAIVKMFLRVLLPRSLMIMTASPPNLRNLFVL